MSHSIYNLANYIGKKTPKGVVIRKIQNSEMIGQWFISVKDNGEKIGDVLRLPDFKKVIDEDELNVVLWNVRKFIAEFY